MKYTFMTKGIDGGFWFPKRLNGFQGSLVSEWTLDIGQAVFWSSPEEFDCLQMEYCNTYTVCISEKKD